MAYHWNLFWTEAVAKAAKRLHFVEGERMDYRSIDELFASEDMLAPDGHECSCPAHGCWSGHEEDAAKGPDGIALCPVCRSPVAFACEAVDSDMVITDDDGEYDEPVTVRIAV